MKTALQAFEQELASIREAGTWREERIITTPQRSRIDTTQKDGVVNLCANNYLGLSNNALRPVLRPLHLRHPADSQGAGAPDRRFCRH